MVKRHLKRIATPASWAIRRKKEKFITRPFPGPHAMKQGMAIATVLRDIVGEARTSAEAKKILLHNEVICNGKRLQDLKSMVGLLDAISIPKIGKYYRLIMDKKGKIGVRDIPDKEALIMLAKIRNKTKVKGGKTQINLSNGRNFLAKKEQEGYKTGSSVVLGLPKQEVKDYLPLEKGMLVVLQGGKHKGEIATVQALKGKKIIIKTRKGEIFETLKEYAVVCGKKEPVISVTEEQT